MQKLKYILIALTLGFTVANPVLVSAQTTSSTINVTEYQGVDSSISQFLCTPSEDKADGNALEKCINKIYRFGVSFGAIALVFFLVFAGYMYMMGGESGKTKAKGILQNALVGMGLLLGSYVILSFINPNLVLFKPIQPPIFDAANIPKCEEIGYSATCVVDGGAVMFGGDEDCAMPMADSAVKSYNNTVHYPWDKNEDTPDRHRTVRQPPNAPPPEGAVDLAVGQVAHPVYAPISGKVTVRRDKALAGTGSYISISSNTTAGSSTCDSANGCANLAHIDPTVNVGDTVKAGQQVGKIFLYPGGAGRLGPHLHFELRLAGKWITGDGKKGTWDNMKSAISQCMSRNKGNGSSKVAVDLKPLAGMVEVTEASHGVKINMKYATADNFTGTVLYKQNKCYLTQSMADKLKKAQQALAKKSKQLEMLDCYRPREVQDLMVAWAKAKVDWAGKQAPQPNNYLAKKYIATSGDHPLGKAVDLTISGASMPSAFDEFSTASHYNNGKNPDAKLLNSTMTSNGFGAFSEEWWHFKDDGTKTGLVAGTSSGEIDDPTTALNHVPQLIAHCEDTDTNAYNFRDLLVKRAYAQTCLHRMKVAYTEGENFPIDEKGGMYRVSVFTYLTKQGAGPHGNQKYGDDTSCSNYSVAGCGPTAYSMLLRYIRDNFPNDRVNYENSANVSPRQLGDELVKLGYRDCNAGGTLHSMVEGTFSNYVKNWSINKRQGYGATNSNELLNHFGSGNEGYRFAVAVVGHDGIENRKNDPKIVYKLKGHFILIYGMCDNCGGHGKNYARVADPYSTSIGLIEVNQLVKELKSITYVGR